MKKHTFEVLGLVLVGATVYPILEILFRGRTHASMSLLGGICLVCIRLVDLALGRVRRIWKAAVSALIITQLEFVFGLVLNCVLRLSVWDYSHLPLNIAGQICPLFTFLWFLLSFVALFSFQKAPLVLRTLQRFSKRAKRAF